MNNFDDYFENFLVKWEGTQLENDPSDPGGETKFGIDQRSHPKIKIADLTLEKARIIYWDEFQQSPAKEMPIPICWMFFDTEVNAGRYQATKILQRALGVMDDGLIGKKTELALLNFSDRALLVHRFTAEREKFYKNLTFIRPRLSQYLTGWLNRSAAMNQVAASMLPQKALV